jgi:hypothetical protein
MYVNRGLISDSSVVQVLYGSYTLKNAPTIFIEVPAGQVNWGFPDASVKLPTLPVMGSIFAAKGKNI